MSFAWRSMTTASDQQEREEREAVLDVYLRAFIGTRRAAKAPDARLICQEGLISALSWILTRAADSSCWWSDRRLSART